MGFLNFFKGPDINHGVAEFSDNPRGWLLDVRTEGEYRSGHIPNSKNVPLHGIEQVAAMIPDRSAPIYLYCQSGGRSRRGESRLLDMGYRNVKNLGSILDYKGPLEY